ncbi:activating signal cointegrator 1 complex subunit 2 [Onthophagus taurus]|uniref:activating signal cointegrator 1 complex subunit 2 n=1 Tax=Onthophagus taurus TaxID=166361 RepID=UPI0039BDB22C
MDFLSRQKEVFTNPNKKPLNELELEYSFVSKVRKSTSGKQKEADKKNYVLKKDRIAALDEKWIQKEHSYHEYQPYYSEVSPEENSLFLTKNKLFLDNLTFLLQCNYHQFWNYMVYEPRIKSILHGFLENPVNWYEIKHLQGEYLKLYNQIYEKVANVYLRLLTFKESDHEYMKEKTAVKLILEHKLITYPLIINFCLLYNKTCRVLVNMINEIFFDINQKVIYEKELAKIFEHALLIIEMIGGYICGFEENSVKIPIGIRPKPAKFDPQWVEEVTIYLLDTSASLNAFLSSCNNALNVALEMGIPYRLTYFYNNVYSVLYGMLEDRSESLFADYPGLKDRILEYIGIGRSEFVNVFHVFITYLIDNIIQSLGDNEKQDNFMENYLKLISNALEDEFFIFDYQNAHKIDVQLQTISDFHPHIDETRVNYIMECLSTLPTIEKVLSLKSDVSKPKKDLLKLPEIEPTPGTSKQYTPPNETEIYEIAKSVLETLPHLGDGFIVECLKSFNFNSEQVIAAILDEKLPPHLNKLDKNMIYVPPEPEEPQPVLAYKGKKPAYKDAKELLDDKRDLKEIKDFVLKTSSVTYDNIYDDEYDDRYDDEPGISFYEKDDDVRKPVQNRFEGYELVSDPPSSSEDDGEEERPQKASNAFCEDPAVLRARREAQFKGKNPRKNDVVGKPKGQGQDKNVLQNRDKKGVHKSSRANHNRKSGAQWKRNKGMIPM